MIGISQRKEQWQREAREDERKLIVDFIMNYGPMDTVDADMVAAIRNGSYRNKP